ncbi:trace amine-associated receptor 3-like [Electrophorus electricus]|uniref:trace amine-associated receptor 3-like n=1 Tax=Electrophorus electricus TaxID=8005 RepID=UPI0015CFCF11|nr:trace amine-associated receptor 3-like [Electrophorus electricus]
MNMTGTDVENVLLCFPHQPESCPKVQRLSVVQVLMYILMLPTIFMTVFGNLLVIITISHFKQLQSPTNLIILSLALVDCMMGCLVMPFSMVRWVEGCWFMGDMFCKIHSGMDMTLSIASILHLCLVSIDRYIAICEPLKYQMKMTNTIVVFCLTVMWLFSLIFSFGIVVSKVNVQGLETLAMSNTCLGFCALTFNKQWTVITSLLNFFLPGTIMSSLYLKIFFVARKQAKVICEGTAVVRSREAKGHYSEQRERKAAKTLGIVMGFFLLCWLPYFMTNLIDPFFNFMTPADVFDSLIWLAYFNSMCNPLIYGFFYPRFQSAFKIILSRYFHLNNTNNINL